MSAAIERVSRTKISSRASKSVALHQRDRNPSPYSGACDRSVISKGTVSIGILDTLQRFPRETHLPNRRSPRRRAVRAAYAALRRTLREQRER
jgi:hypothetical protein